MQILQTGTSLSANSNTINSFKQARAHPVFGGKSAFSAHSSRVHSRQTRAAHASSMAPQKHLISFDVDVRDYRSTHIRTHNSHTYIRMYMQTKSLTCKYTHAHTRTHAHTQHMAHAAHRLSPSIICATVL